MTWKRTLNGALSRATGHELRKVRARGGRPARPPAGGERLVKAPTFVLCTLRSGSTLLRVLLDSHSQIHAPQELHLGYLNVKLKNKWAARAMDEIGLDERRLEYLLWDRILDRQLAHSGKAHLVSKTPNDVFIADRILECWPDARFIFLLRHPGAIVRSRANLRPDAEDNVETIARYGEALDRARRTHAGLTVRYEDLTTEPEVQTRRICEYLGLPWEPAMLEYGRYDHGRYRPGLGDWAGKIKTGSIQAPEPPPPADSMAPELRRLAVAWGYLPAEHGEAAPPGDRARSSQAS